MSGPFGLPSEGAVFVTRFLASPSYERAVRLLRLTLLLANAIGALLALVLVIRGGG